MSGRTAPGIRRRQLAIRLVELRKAARKTQAQVVEWTGLSQSTISKIENAEQQIQIKHVRLLAQCYDVEAPEIDRLLRMAEESDERGLLVAHSDTAPDFAKDYFELEAYATELRVHEPGYVFGLFQLPEYTRAVRLAFVPDASDEELQRSVDLRTARQARLRGDNPPTIRLLLDEAVLHRSVGGPKVMEAQIAHLIEMSKLPQVTLQVVPFSVGAHPAVGFGFTVLRFDDTPGIDVVYVENQRSAAYHEKPSDLDHYVEVFQQISRAALNPNRSRVLMDTLMRDLWERSKGV
jgi:transcriptional regulator with XRE-family HTH domain